MIIQSTIEAFVSGVYNLLPDEVIPQDAASDSLNWLTKDGKLELARGRRLIGTAGATGKNYGQHVGYRADGTAVNFRKVGAKIQYLNSSSVWTDVITGLTTTADYTFANYSSLAGAFVYIFGVDGIYKICTANPGSYSSLYNSAKNFKGYGLIDKARSVMWGLAKDGTGLYGSYIDAQNSTVYTTVSGEATTSLSGTLAFKAGGATRTCFGVAITLTGTGEVYTDDYNGNLTGSLGGTGTINYTTGAFTVSNAGVGTAAYQWEDSNAKGVTDFTKSATRLAGEGFVIRQDQGGDAIKVVLPLAGSYFSMKSHSAYKFTLDTTDLSPTNIVFRTDIGVPSLRAATGSAFGIIYINTSDSLKPRIEVLSQNETGDNFNVKQLFTHFAFENYDYSDALVDTWDRYLIVGCKTTNQADNNRLLLCNVPAGTVDITSYGIRSAAKLNGVLYGGDPVSQSTYELFTGFDDLGQAVINSWSGKGETLGSFKARSIALRFIKNTLKKLKRIRFKGLIDPNQSVQVYISYDDADFQLVGTILGNGDYVDYTSTYAIGTGSVGASILGGGDTVSVNPFFMEIKLHATKFRKRKVKLIATGIGYFALNNITDWDYWLYQDKMPVRYRAKQNVPLAGQPVDSANPDY